MLLRKVSGDRVYYGFDLWLITMLLVRISDGRFRYKKLIFNNLHLRDAFVIKLGGYREIYEHYVVCCSFVSGL